MSQLRKSSSAASQFISRIWVPRPVLDGCAETRYARRQRNRVQPRSQISVANGTDHRKTRNHRNPFLKCICGPHFEKSSSVFPCFRVVHFHSPDHCFGPTIGPLPTNT